MGLGGSITQWHSFRKIQRSDCFAGSFYPVLLILVATTVPSFETEWTSSSVHSVESGMGSMLMPRFLSSGFGFRGLVLPTHLPLVCRLSSSQYNCCRLSLFPSPVTPFPMVMVGFWQGVSWNVHIWAAVLAWETLKSLSTIVQIR